MNLRRQPYGLALAGLLALTHLQAQSAPQPDLARPYQDQFPEVRRPPDSAQQLARLLRWLEDVQHHQPGELDLPAKEIGGWTRADLATVVADVRKLAVFLERARAGRAGRDPVIQLHNRTFTIAQVEKIFAGNDTLRRGAVLHADVGMLAPEDLSRRASQMALRTFVVQDGRQQGARGQTVHWQLGRLLLDGIAPSPVSDAGTLLWYRASSARLLREGHLDEARAHLEKGRQVFPASWELLLDSAYLHQRLSSPTIQAAVQAMSSEGIRTNVASQRSELEQAERFFRQTLAINPDNLDARVRLGRMLSQLGRHEEAAAELRKALDGRPEGEVRYFAELLLGREEESLGQRASAREHYQAAADLYPMAQSPHLALSQLARQSGDRRAALLALQAVTALPATEVARTDPWWSFYESHVEDIDDLLRDLYDGFQSANPPHPAGPARQ